MQMYTQTKQGSYTTGERSREEKPVLFISSYASKSNNCQRIDKGKDQRNEKKMSQEPDVESGHMIKHIYCSVSNWLGLLSGHK